MTATCFETAASTLWAVLVANGADAADLPARLAPVARHGPDLSVRPAAQVAMALGSAARALADVGLPPSDLIEGFAMAAGVLARRSEPDAAGRATWLRAIADQIHGIADAFERDGLADIPPWTPGAGG
jgi:hypothetical protein